MKNNNAKIKEFEIADKISNCFRTIITQIEEHIETHIDNIQELLITMQTIADNVTSILSKKLDSVTKEDYERKIKALELEIQQLKEKDFETHSKYQNQNLAMQTSTLPSVHIDAGTSNHINNQNNSNDIIKCEKDAHCSSNINQQVIHKLRSKIKQHKDHYKYQEFLYISRINELTNTIQALEKKIKFDEKEKMALTLTAFPMSVNNSFSKRSKFENSTNNYFNKMYRNASTGRYVIIDNTSKLNTINNNTNLNSAENNNEASNADNNTNTIHANDKDIIKSKELQLYGFYQKNRMKQINKRSNFKLESNLQSINNIISNYNNKIIPRYKYLKPEKKYYSAFVKKFT